MNCIIDSQRNWMFNYVRQTCKSDHLRRTAIEEAIKCGDFDEDEWNSEQEQITSLWSEIHKFRNKEHFEMNEKCQESVSAISWLVIDILKMPV